LPWAFKKSPIGEKSPNMVSLGDFKFLTYKKKNIDIACQKPRQIIIRLLIEY
jgi:hypothetical protein